MGFSDKFVCFVDILGFKSLVEASEKGTGMSPEKLAQLQSELGQPSERGEFHRYGPIICPESPYIQRDLDFRVNQFSDSVVISCEISPVAVVNLVFHFSKVVMKLLETGVMCRGYITRGLIYHTEGSMLGSGLHRAYEKEKEVAAFKREADERGTPFVEIDPVVCEYINQHGDACVKMMFKRIVWTEEDATVIFPFQNLQRTVVLDHNYDPDKDLLENRAWKADLEKLKERVLSLIDVKNISAVRKGEHYVNALEQQIEVCRNVEEQITRLRSPFPRYSY